jgi:hypothetical protein
MDKNMRKFGPHGRHKMTMAHFSMHDAITWFVWLMYLGYIRTMCAGEFYIKTYTPELSPFTWFLRRQMGSAFNHILLDCETHLLDSAARTFSQKEFASQQIF